MVKAVTWGHLGGALPAISLLPHVSGRLKQNVVDAVFEAAGGGERLLAFTEASEENYKFFLQHLWSKNLPRVSHNEHSVDESSMEALLAKIDAGEHAPVVSAAPPAPQPQEPDQFTYVVVEEVD